MKWYHRYVGFSFILIILSLTVILLVRPDRAYSVKEKRNLAQKPALSAGSLFDGSFMDGIEDYAADQFPARNALMNMKTGILRAFGDRESQGVYLCKDDSLMERFDLPDSDNQAETIREMADFAARHQNTEFYFLLAPNAIAVSPELLPKNAPTESEDAYIDRFYGSLGKAYHCVDVRDSFIKHKDDTQLYYRTDHHWTTEGAYIAFDKLASEMRLQRSVSFHPSVVCNDFFGSLSAKSGYT